MTDKSSQVTLSGSQLLYDEPEALNSVVHAELCFQPDLQDFSKAETLNLIPLLVGEFAEAMLHYPIIFAGDRRVPLAVMGLKEGQNLFICEGRFRDGAYVPAYLRRYPFTLAKAGEQFVVCFDRAASALTTTAKGERLFEDGQSSAFMRDAIAFLDQFEVEQRRTELFVTRAEEAGLFEIKHTTTATEPAEYLAEYFAVSEERIDSLEADELGALAKNGVLLPAYLHLLSLRRWDDLLLLRESSPDAAKMAA